MTLPGRLRIQRSEFPKALTTRKKSVSTHFSVLKGPSRGVAVVVSKKVAKRSVERHLLKRRMQEALRPYATPTQSLVVYARAGAPTLSFKELKKELAELLSRV